MTKKWFEENDINPESVKAVTFSGQMENVILIREGENTERAILYSDMRAEKEAAWIREHIPDLRKITANRTAPSTPFAKLLWMKKKGEKPASVFSVQKIILFIN
ncbi:FGGY family carbohydrate kinase [Alteribacillus sp. JSM 102045]|uniref:FGGY family carbohydrate kinase n=1 Tax=Alteribacillus sp. JSM 102045 TaxID=1562101 RepID=UPI0035C1BF7F